MDFYRLRHGHPWRLDDWIWGPMTLEPPMHIYICIYMYIIYIHEYNDIICLYIYSFMYIYIYTSYVSLIETVSLLSAELSPDLEWCGRSLGTDTTRCGITSVLLLWSLEIYVSIACVCVCVCVFQVCVCDCIWDHVSAMNIFSMCMRATHNVTYVTGHGRDSLWLQSCPTNGYIQWICIAHQQMV
jgi:hypothetical protein